MILYFELSKNLAKYLDPTLSSTDVEQDPDLNSPAERAVAKWMIGDSTYKNDRFKLIAYVAEGPWIVRNLVTGNPVLIGKRLPVTHDIYFTPNEPPLLMTTLDIGNSSKTAKNIVSVCRRYMSALTVDIGFVIQSQSQEELPEQMLGALRVHGPDPLRAHKLSPN
jgi:Protein ENHANCED DISEASE RESISTANCE 2, C-terminal